MVNDMLHFGDDSKARVLIQLALLDTFGQDQVGILPYLDRIHGHRLQIELSVSPEKYAKFIQVNKLEDKSMFYCLVHRH